MRSALVLLVAGMMACATTGGGIGGDTGPSGDAMRTDTGGSDGAHDGGSMSDAHDGAIGDTGMMDVSMTDTGHMDSGPMDTGPTDTGPGDTGPTDAGPCSSCPTGFSCGAGGYCVNADGVPAFGHVFLLVMENHSLSSILGSTDAPYLNTLMSTYLYATHYVTRASSPIHPSCPNYIALTSGDTFGIDCDCSPASPSTSARLSCAFASTSSSCPQAAMHVGDMLDAASVPWREYGEDMGTPCNTTDNANYVARHIPFLYYRRRSPDCRQIAMNTGSGVVNRSGT